MSPLIKYRANNQSNYICNKYPFDNIHTSLLFDESLSEKKEGNQKTALLIILSLNYPC